MARCWQAAVCGACLGIAVYALLCLVGMLPQYYDDSLWYSVLE